MPSSALRSEEHTSELQSHLNLVCRLLLEKKKEQKQTLISIESTKTTHYRLTHTHTHTHTHLHTQTHTHTHPLFQCFSFFLNKPAPTDTHTLPHTPALLL